MKVSFHISTQALCICGYSFFEVSLYLSTEIYRKMQVLLNLKTELQRNISAFAQLTIFFEDASIALSQNRNILQHIKDVL